MSRIETRLPHLDRLLTPSPALIYHARRPRQPYVIFTFFISRRFLTNCQARTSLLKGRRRIKFVLNTLHCIRFILTGHLTGLPPAYLVSPSQISPLHGYVQLSLFHGFARSQYARYIQGALYSRDGWCYLQRRISHCCAYNLWYSAARIYLSDCKGQARCLNDPVYRTIFSTGNRNGMVTA